METARHYLELTPPSLADNTADIDRLLRALQKEFGYDHVLAPLARVQEFSRILRAADWKVTAFLARPAGSWQLVALTPGQAGEEDPPPLPRTEPDSLLPLADLDSGQSPAKGFGLALDLGTTTLVMELVELSSGQTVDRISAPNPQITIGPDILTRIHYSQSHGITQLQELVIQGVNDAVEALCAKHQLAPDRIISLSVAGNTTMTHLFLGLDPANICREPYIPVINQPDLAPAGSLGLKINPQAPVFLFPNIGSYFGGDLVAGIISSGLADEDEVCLFVDVGTNAEVVVGNKDWMMACAGAAGPALEGGVASMGMAAGQGAIERVRIDPETLEPDIQVIGDGPPQGICGSGLIDLVAQLYLAGVIDIQARIIPFDHPRIAITPDGPAFVVVEAEKAAGRAILFSQIDLDILLRSKAAMLTILTTLLNQVSLTFDHISTFYVAGTFGQHIDPRQAIVIGMLPDLPLEKYKPVGNSSLKGARLGLISAGARLRAAEVRGRITYLELNVNQEFMNRFSAAKFLPHTDRSLFPSVPDPYHRPETKREV